MTGPQPMEGVGIADSLGVAIDLARCTVGDMRSDSVWSFFAASAQLAIMLAGREEESGTPDLISDRLEGVDTITMSGDGLAMILTERERAFLPAAQMTLALLIDSDNLREIARAEQAKETRRQRSLVRRVLGTPFSRLRAAHG